MEYRSEQFLKQRIQNTTGAFPLEKSHGQEDSRWENRMGIIKFSAWILWLLSKYTFQTYGALMLTLFGFYYYDFVELNDELLMISHVCLFGSLICGILLVMHKTLGDEGL